MAGRLGPVQDPASAKLLANYFTAQRRRALSPETIYCRGLHLRRLAIWLERHDKTLPTATREDVELFLDACHVSAKTRYGYTSSIDVFYRWAQREGRLGANPAELIQRPKLPHYLPRPAIDDELAVAIELAPMPERAMILLGAYEGMRCKEIAGLQWSHVMDHLKPPMLMISEGKGSRQRVVPLHPEVFEALRRTPEPYEGYVFRQRAGRFGTRSAPGKIGDRFDPGVVSHLINNYLHELGIVWTAHSLRHWFATAVYRTTPRPAPRAVAARALRPRDDCHLHSL